jgi:hypothetical protein
LACDLIRKSTNLKDTVIKPKTKMKKTLAILAGASISSAAFAQGLVNWTGSAGLFEAQTNGTTYSSFESSSGGTALTGTVGNTAGNTAPNNAALGYAGYYYELLASATAVSGPATLASLSAWSDTGLSATNGAASNGKIGQDGTGSDVANHTTAGNTYAFIVVGWSANLGTTWTAVLAELNTWQTSGSAFLNNTANAAYFGVSSFGSGVQVVGSPGPGNQVIGSSAGEILNNALNPAELYELPVTVPEPGTMALAALGSASMLLFRRKK